MRDKTLLAQLQALPLDAKVLMTQQRIREWYNYWHGNVVISFSGGKDSTVLTYLVHDMYPDVPLVFANTGLEYPEIQAFARKMGAEFVRPKMSFSEVISKYGYPIIGKEVAEAISFARRIVPQNPETVETLERERERDNKESETDGTCRKEEERITGVQLMYEGSERFPRGYKEVGLRRADIIDRRTDYTTPPEKLYGRTGWRRANLTGNTPLSKKEQTRIAGNPSNGKTYERENSERSNEQDGNSWGKTDWKGWRRKAIAGVDEGFTGSSQFNKKKWLPLCQETNFYISHYCCNVMKKSPMGIYQRKTKRKPFIGTMAEESRMRAQAWIRHGCNAFESHKQTSQPMSFWTEQDVLHFIKREGLEICSVYGEIPCNGWFRNALRSDTGRRLQFEVYRMPANGLCVLRIRGSSGKR